MDKGQNYISTERDAVRSKPEITPFGMINKITYHVDAVATYTALLHPSSPLAKGGVGT